MKPVIGLTPILDAATGNQLMRPGYVRGILLAGGLPLTLPLTEDGTDLDALVALCDGLLFTGGPDIDPAHYGEARLNDTVDVCPERDAMELRLLELAMRSRKPILGICRGCQLINVALGGDLYQDLPVQRPGDVAHRQPEPYSLPAHENRLLPDTPLSLLLGTERLAVNSCHHQGIKTLAPPLRATAVSEDGLLEGFDLPDYAYLWAVQWHPELMLDRGAASGKLFRSLILAADRAGNQST